MMKTNFPPMRAQVEESVINESPSKPCKNPINFPGKAPFPDIFLAINFNNPFYKNVPILIDYFKPLFPNYFFCGPEVDPDGKYQIVVIQQVKAEYGYYGFQCVAEAIRRKPGFAGYFYVNDDMIINWWNFFKLDKTKIWFPGPKEFGRHKMVPAPIAFWWRRAACLERCSQAFVEMESDPSFVQINATKIYLSNLGNERACSNSLADIMYIPGRLAKSFELISQKFYDHRVFLEVASPMAVLMLEKRENIIDTRGLYLQKKYGWGHWTGNSARAWLEYDYKTFFLHPYKFSGFNQTKNTGEFKDRVLGPSETILKDKCLDVLDKGKFWS